MKPLNTRRAIKRVLTTEYGAVWTDKISTEGNLRTYRKFKSVFGSEDYLSLTNSKYRKALTRLRISAHTLAVERGRYTRPPTQLQDRTCPHCPDKVEDEIHFLLKCPKYKEDRQVTLQEIEKICPNIRFLDEENKFIFLMSAGGKIAEYIGKFTYKNMH